MLFEEAEEKENELTERYVAEILRSGDAGAARLARRQAHVRESRDSFLALAGGDSETCILPRKSSEEKWTMWPLRRGETG